VGELVFKMYIGRYGAKITDKDRVEPPRKPGSPCDRSTGRSYTRLLVAGTPVLVGLRLGLAVFQMSIPVSGICLLPISTVLPVVRYFQ